MTELGETGTIERIAGVDTFVSRFGHAARHALFIHCSLAHARSWLEVQAALLGHLSMTSFDRPGHGRSGAYPGSRGAQGVHDRTTRIAGSLLGRQSDVVGHSYGGTVALRLAIEQPETVRALVLVEPVLFAAARGTPAFDDQIIKAQGLAALVAAGERETAARAFNDTMNPDLSWEAQSDAARRRLTEGIHQIVEEDAITMQDTPEIVERLHRIRQPVLLIEGSESPAIVHATHEALCARIPQARRVIVMGAGHMAPVTHPGAVATEIAAFLRL